MTVERVLQTKTPPYNLDSEKALLGSILLHSEAYEEVKDIIKANSFYIDKHKTIWSNISDILESKEHLDIITLSSKMREKGLLDSIGGVSYLGELTTTVPSSSNARQYATIIQDKYSRRQLITLAEKIRDASYDETSPMIDSLERTEKALKEVKKITVGIKKTGDEQIDRLIKDLEKEIVIDKSDHGKESLSRLTEIAKKYGGEDQLIKSTDYIDIIKNKPQQIQMLTKFPTLDDIIKGFRQGQLISISATAKSGKTNFCIELTSQQREYNPVWFPFEEGAEELVTKFMDRNEEPPIFFTPARLHDRSLSFIERKIIEAIAKYDSKIFYIDNLDWIVDPRSAKHDLETQFCCMELKRMCVTWNICIVLIAHVKKLATPTEQPSYNDIKGSSAVYQLSDTVVMMWRETKKENGELVITNNVNISVQLNRKVGKTGNVKLRYENGHYMEYDWHRDDDSFGEFSQKKLSTGIKADDIDI